jgi:hypothetical protein
MKLILQQTFVNSAQIADADIGVIDRLALVPGQSVQRPSYHPIRKPMAFQKLVFGIVRLEQAAIVPRNPQTRIALVNAAE